MLPLTPLGQVLSVPFLGFSFLPSETEGQIGHLRLL